MDNPAGSKQLRRWYRAKHGVKATLAVAAEWYRTYLSAADTKVRALEAERRAAREARRGA